MNLTWDRIQANAVSFSKKWKDAHSEKSHGQSFVRAFLAVFGIDDPDAPDASARFEKPAVIEGGDGYMDFFLPGLIAIEMKSKGKDLGEAYRQLKEYVLHLPADEMPELLMVSDFENIALHSRTAGTAGSFRTKDLHRHTKRFAALAGYEAAGGDIDRLGINVKAAEKMATLHDALEKTGYEETYLEVYLVRLLFCLFADNAGIFQNQAFLSYVENSKPDGGDLPLRIGELFEVLNMPDETRAKKTLLSPTIKQFRYINGGIFRERIPPPQFDRGMRAALLDCCRFDWSQISPAIFGSMFQGIMDKTLRREIGAHYTGEENILKLIDPLFMDGLREEFGRIKANPKKLGLFHEKLAKLKFLDPACGCGNFLIIAYRELRLLELDVLKAKLACLKMPKGGRHPMLDIETFLKVNVGQFHGIESEAWPCQIARTGLWLMDHLMNMQFSEEFGRYYVRIPLEESAAIAHANALRIDWHDIVPKDELNYIMGNPPFSGARLMSREQKEDMRMVFGDIKGLGNLDYVAAWYRKAADMMEANKNIKTAFVSTNSITQGEQPAILWKPLMEGGIFINFGIPTFKWSNEAKGKAAVHCVIVGFSFYKTEPNINPYLIQAPNVFIESRKKPLGDVPEMVFGSMPNDGGNLIIEADEYRDFMKAEPKAKKYLRRFVGAEEFINNLPRHCLWLVDAPPAELRAMPTVMARVKHVREGRLASKRETTRQKADTPMLFGEIRQPTKKYILIPSTSSENRRYIPIGFMSPKVIASNATHIVPAATHYHFGILTSNVHMAWMRAVGGRLEMRYRYSKDIVYNNFPWPEATDKQKAKVEELAQGVLDARALYSEASLADLYDPNTMPLELTKAHRALDRAVMKLYGFDKDAPEAEIVAELMNMYLVFSRGAE